MNENNFKDTFGNVLQVGDTVLRAYRKGNLAYLEKRTVERIENGKLYLNGAKGSHVSVLSNLAKVAA